MIKIITKAYQVNGVAYATLKEAQVAELEALLKSSGIAGSTSPLTLAEFLVEHQAKVADILSTKSNSRPTRRKINKPEVATVTAKPVVVPVVAPIATPKLTL